MSKVEPVYPRSHSSGMSFRSLLAGPSRNAARSNPLHSTTTNIQAVRHITIPHPDTVLPRGVKGGREFLIKADGRLHDVVHVLACVRAAENALGTPIISVNVFRDPDSLRAVSTISVSTLKAVEYSTPVQVSIAPPRRNGSSQPGGPSLADVEAVLASRPSHPIEGEESLNLQIELDLSKPSSSPTPSRTPAEIRKKAERQNVRILDALESLGGDWAKIAEKWDHLRPYNIAKRDTRPNQTSQTDSEIVEDLGSDVADRVTDEMARKEMRDAKHRRHARDTAGAEKRSQDTERTPTLEELRRHSKEAREMRHKQRLEREAERQAEIEEKAASRWKFDLNNTQTEIDSPKLKTTPRSSNPVSIRRRAPMGSIATVDENAAEAAERATKQEIEAKLAQIERQKREKEREMREQQKRSEEDALKRMVEIAERDARAQRMAEEYRQQKEVEEASKSSRSVSISSETVTQKSTEAMKQRQEHSSVQQEKKGIEEEANRAPGLFSRFFGGRS